MCFWPTFLTEDGGKRGTQNQSQSRERDTQSSAGRFNQSETRCSEEAGLGQHGARLQQQTLAVDAEGVEDGEEVVCAKK